MGETMRVRNLDTGEEADLVRFDPQKKEHILIQRKDVEQLDSVFVLDWEPVEGHREQMYVFLSKVEEGDPEGA
jgi:hypothetical protein